MRKRRRSGFRSGRVPPPLPFGDALPVELGSFLCLDSHLLAKHAKVPDEAVGGHTLEFPLRRVLTWDCSMAKR